MFVFKEVSNRQVGSFISRSSPSSGRSKDSSIVPADNRRWRGHLRILAANPDIFGSRMGLKTLISLSAVATQTPGPFRFQITSTRRLQVPHPHPSDVILEVHLLNSTLQTKANLRVQSQSTGRAHERSKDVQQRQAHKVLADSRLHALQNFFERHKVRDDELACSLTS